MKSIPPKIVLAALIGALLCLTAYFALDGEIAARYRSAVFASDFKTFWSAVNGIKSQVNFYSPADACAYQQKFMSPGINCSYMAMPPWTLLPILPLAALPLGAAFAVWAAFNIILAGLMACAAADDLNVGADRRGLVAGVFLIFPPFMLALYTGHFPIMLAAAVFFGIKFLSEGKGFRAGLLLSLISFKPHVFIVLAAALAAWSFRTHAWKFISGGVAGVLALAVLTFLLLPEAIPFWSKAEKTYTPLYINRSETLVSEFRLMVRALTGELPGWPLVLFPIAGAAAGLIFSRADSFSPANRLNSLVRLCGLSLVFAPYGWLYDSAVLLPVFLCAASFAFGMRPGAWIALLLLAVPMLVPLGDDAYLHFTSFYPLVLLAAWKFLPAKTAKT